MILPCNFYWFRIDTKHWHRIAYKCDACSKTETVSFLLLATPHSVTSFDIPDITSELENLVFRLFFRTYYSRSWSNCILFSSHSTLRHNSQTCEFISALSDQMKMWIRSVSRRQQFSSNKFDWAPEPNSNYHHNSKGIESL